MVPPPVCRGGARETTMGYVYFLPRLKDGRWQLGWTTGLKHRLDKRNAGKGPDTRSRAPWKLVGYEVYSPPQTKQGERVLKHRPQTLFLHEAGFR